jgi:hypothetical protein
MRERRRRRRKKENWQGILAIYWQESAEIHIIEQL